MSLNNFVITVFLLLVFIDRCYCDSKTVRVLEKPNIRPLYLNMSESKEGGRVTIHGNFQCPQDTTAEIDYGTIVKFDKVSDSTENSTECEMVLYYDQWGQFAKLSLRSKSASEYLPIYLYENVESVQTEFTGTDCLVGINRSSEEQTIAYTSVVQNCDQSLEIIESFNIELNKFGEIISLDTDMFCSYSNTDHTKYFKSRCSWYGWKGPQYITIYEDKMAADNISLLHLNYVFEPLGPCTEECIAFIKKWYFSII